LTRTHRLAAELTICGGNDLAALATNVVDISALCPLCIFTFGRATSLISAGFGSATIALFVAFADAVPTDGGQIVAIGDFALIDQARVGQKRYFAANIFDGTSAKLGGIESTAFGIHNVLSLAVAAIAAIPFAGTALALDIAIAGAITVFRGAVMDGPKAVRKLMGHD